jgi:hypothetical protein
LLEENLLLNQFSAPNINRGGFYPRTSTVEFKFGAGPYSKNHMICSSEQHPPGLDAIMNVALQEYLRFHHGMKSLGSYE